MKQDTVLAMSSSDATNKPDAFVAVGDLFLLTEFFKILFIKFSISFPASLAGCGALFSYFILGPAGSSVHSSLAPGAAILAKWLPVMFVPSLIALPLAGGLGSRAEYFKVLAVIVGGFLFTLLTTSYSVMAVRKIFPGKATSEAAPAEESIVDSAPTPPVATPKPFSDELAKILRAVTAFSMGATLVSQTALLRFSKPITTFFLLSCTLNTFVFGARLPKRFTKIIHPLVTCTTLTWAAMLVLSKCISVSFHDVLRVYAAGAGRILLGFLGPAVVSLACQMYDRRKLMRDNIKEVGTAIGVSSLGGIFGTALAVRLLQIGNPALRLSLLSRNITSPLAMAIAAILGADASLAVSMVVVTGLIGANFGAGILTLFGIKDSVARGMGIGAAAHGLGTAAFANEKDAFPFAAIAMALTASACTVLVSVPSVKKVVLSLALG